MRTQRKETEDTIRYPTVACGKRRPSVPEHIVYQGDVRRIFDTSAFAQLNRCFAVETMGRVVRHFRLLRSYNRLWDIESTAVSLRGKPRKLNSGWCNSVEAVNWGHPWMYPVISNGDIWSVDQSYDYYPIHSNANLCIPCSKHHLARHSYAARHRISSRRRTSNKEWQEPRRSSSASRPSLRTQTTSYSMLQVI